MYGQYFFYVCVVHRIEFNTSGHHSGHLIINMYCIAFYAQYTSTLCSWRYMNGAVEIVWTLELRKRGSSSNSDGKSNKLKKNMVRWSMVDGGQRKYQLTNWRRLLKESNALLLITSTINFSWQYTFHSHCAKSTHSLNHPHTHTRLRAQSHDWHYSSKIYIQDRRWQQQWQMKEIV